MNTSYQQIPGTTCELPSYWQGVETFSKPEDPELKKRSARLIPKLRQKHALGGAK